MSDFRCLAPDRRGAGESTAPTGGRDPSYSTLAADVLAVVRWAGAARPLVVGASWGAKIALAYAAAGYPCAGVVCLDDMWSLERRPDEDLYARIACPVRMLFGTESARDFPTGGAYTVADVVALSVRHPELLISWLPCGHDLGREMPVEVARLVRAFARLVRPG